MVRSTIGAGALSALDKYNTQGGRGGGRCSGGLPRPRPHPKRTRAPCFSSTGRPTHTAACMRRAAPYPWSGGAAPSDPSDPWAAPSSGGRVRGPSRSCARARGRGPPGAHAAQARPRRRAGPRPTRTAGGPASAWATRRRAGRREGRPLPCGRAGAGRHGRASSAKPSAN
eukprot:scaffold5173_cov125-Isochrysis_galbana.AAC.2